MATFINKSLRKEKMSQIIDHDLYLWAKPWEKMPYIIDRDLFLMINQQETWRVSLTGFSFEFKAVRRDADGTSTSPSFPKASRAGTKEKKRKKKGKQNAEMDGFDLFFVISSSICTVRFDV